MSYADQETSALGAAPVGLYRFAYGAQTWLFTSAEADFTLGAETYKAVPIRHPGWSEDSEIARSSLSLDVARDNPVAQLFIAQPPDQVVSLTIQRLHRTDAAQEVVMVWKGRVLQAIQKGLQASLDCEPARTSVRRQGLTRMYSHSCPYVLYGSGCRVVANDFVTVATVSKLGTNTVTAAAFAAKPDGYFTGGELVRPGQTRRLIVEHTGDTLTLTAGIAGLAAGDIVQAFAGCDHTLAACRDKFNNLDNYGGWPYVPTKNPMSGDAIV